MGTTDKKHIEKCKRCQKDISFHESEAHKILDPETKQWYLFVKCPVCFGGITSDV